MYTYWIISFIKFLHAVHDEMFLFEEQQNNNQKHFAVLMKRNRWKGNEHKVIFRLNWRLRSVKCQKQLSIIMISLGKRTAIHTLQQCEQNKRSDAPSILVNLVSTVFKWNKFKWFFAFIISGKNQNSIHWLFSQLYAD